jgi:hypothetical protein
LSAASQRVCSRVLVGLAAAFFFAAIIGYPLVTKHLQLQATSRLFRKAQGRLYLLNYQPTIGHFLAKPKHLVRASRAGFLTICLFDHLRLGHLWTTGISPI